MKGATPGRAKRPLVLPLNLSNMAGLQSVEQLSSNRRHEDEAENASDEQSAKVDATQSKSPLYK